MVTTERLKELANEMWEAASEGHAGQNDWCADVAEALDELIAHRGEYEQRTVDLKRIS